MSALQQISYTRGILLTVTAVTVFSIQTTVTKVLVQTYAPEQIVMIRFWAFAAFSLYLVLRQEKLLRAFSTKVPVLQIARGLVFALNTWSFSSAVKTVPLPEFNSIFILYPLMVTVLAALFLGERVGWFRLGAVLLGFCGVLIILRPGGLPIDRGVILAFVAMATYALYLILTRRATQSDSTATCLLYPATIGMVTSSAVGFFYYEPMDMLGWTLMALVAVTMISAHGLTALALKLTPASVLQPFNFLGLPYAIFFGYTVFGQFIDPISLVGASLVVAAGLIVWARELGKKKADQSA